MNYSVYGIIEIITTMIQSHPESSQWIIFSIAFVESMAILGSIFPGTFLLTPIGMMLGSNVLPLFNTLISIVMGAFIGDGVSYLIGVYYHSRIENLSWVKKHQGMYDWFKSFIEKHGILSLVIGRFVGPLRSSVPLFAGLLGMSSTVFLLGIIPSILLWTVAYLAPGFLIGRPVVSHYIEQHLLPLLTSHYIFWGLTITLLTASYCIRSGSYTARKIKNILRLSTLFIILAFSVKMQIWESVNHVVQNITTNSLPRYICEWIATICDASTTIPIIISGIIIQYSYDCYQKKSIFWPKKNIGLTVLLTLLVISIPLTKEYISQARPLPLLSHISSQFHPSNDYSFPSGHVALWTSIIFFIGKNINFTNKHEKLYYYISGLFFICMLSYTRLSLTEHWFSDILGGVCISFIIVFLAELVQHLYTSDERLSYKQLCWLSIIIIVIGSLRYLYHV